jgi:putative Ca2+/H+ antiporter (TMEM165/GDT1 family)
MCGGIVFIISAALAMFLTSVLAVTFGKHRVEWRYLRRLRTALKIIIGIRKLEDYYWD